MKSESPATAGGNAGTGLCSERPCGEAGLGAESSTRIAAGVKRAGLPLLDLLDGKKRRRPYGPARAPAPKEHVLHFATADLLRRLCRPSWRWSHFPSGELRDERTGAKLRRMGLNPGWPDMVLVSPDGRLHCLELKRLGGRLSPDQKAFAGWCAEHGVPHVTAASMTTVAAALNAWGCLRMPIHA